MVPSSTTFSTISCRTLQRRRYRLVVLQQRIEQHFLQGVVPRQVVNLTRVLLDVEHASWAPSIVAVRHGWLGSSHLSCDLLTGHRHPIIPPEQSIQSSTDEVPTNHMSTAQETNKQQ